MTLHKLINVGILYSQIKAKASQNEFLFQQILEVWTLTIVGSVLQILFVCVAFNFLLIAKQVLMYKKHNFKISKQIFFPAQTLIVFN